MPAAAGFRFQPIDAAEVAARLAELALGPPSGLAPGISLLIVKRALDY